MALAFQIGGQPPPVSEERHRAVGDDHDRRHDPTDRVGVEGVGEAGDLGSVMLIDPVDPSTCKSAPCQANNPARVTTNDGRRSG